jgi:hypothetical protein
MRILRRTHPLSGDERVLRLSRLAALLSILARNPAKNLRASLARACE